MKLRILAYLSLVLLILLWPPIYSYFFEWEVKSRIGGRGSMEDFELQYLLDARRWVFDVPADKDGWMLRFKLKSEAGIEVGGGGSVHGGRPVVLITRRDRIQNKILFCWYQDGLIGHGVVEDPLSSAGLIGEHAEGHVNIGDAIYYGTKGHNLSSNMPSYDLEVRVALELPPKHVFE